MKRWRRITRKPRVATVEYPLASPWTTLLISMWALMLPHFCQAGTTNYLVRGILKGIRPEEHQLVIQHQEIPQFMTAMTMPFAIKDPAVLTNVAIGDRITFQLHVTEADSWVDHIERLAVAEPAGRNPAALPGRAPAQGAECKPDRRAPNLLRNYTFTNQLGESVSLDDFRGQAIALTFFFTRCPIPQYCPRLSRNFEEVQKKLNSMTDWPTNWHLISVSFDPTHDTPAVLKSYAESYHYDPARWSFLTGAPDKIAELARACDVRAQADGGLFNHNFRTLIIDASNRLQMVFPTSGDLSDAIVQELLKGARATKPNTERVANQNRSESDR